ncbi:MAG: regulatory protein RecX [Gammaproteobacteria bacterium]|nr:regulatory protein RecX [Gammaproteobacteria bacterium]
MTDIRNSPELDRAIQILTPREHSVLELRLKLVKRNIDREKIEAIIAYLLELDYLSDERFAEAYVAERTRKGDGPTKIQSNLRKRGVDRALIERFVSLDDDFWIERAIDVLRKRFGARDDEFGSLQFDEWTKRRTLLMNRGFPAQVVRNALGEFQRP